MAVLEQFPQAITIFLRPESLEEVERRLRARGTESEQDVNRRLEVARREWAMADHYQHQVINDQVERAAEEISQILQAEGGGRKPEGNGTHSAER